MQAFGERYNFECKTHEKGDANRSAHVERRFSCIENNFLAGGRTVWNWEDANRQAREWCDKVNGTFRAKLKASARELFAIEQAYLKPLPVWVPPVYLVHQRIVDVESYVSVSTNRYSVLVEMIGRRVEVRKSKDAIEIHEGPRLTATHPRISGDIRQDVTYYEHPHKSTAKFDFVMANPPFKVDKVDKERIEYDSRYPFGMPKVDNANYLWKQIF